MTHEPAPGAEVPPRPTEPPALPPPSSGRRFAPEAEVTVPDGGVAVRWGDDGPVVGTVTDAAVDAQGRVHVTGTIGGQAFSGIANAPWPPPTVDPDWEDVTDAGHRPLPLPERWQ